MKCRSVIKSILSVLPVLLTAGILHAQTESGEGKWGIRFSGFIKNDFWVDTRQVFTTREDLFLWYPADRKPDRDGNDVNAGCVFNFNAMTTRLTGSITTPDALGAKVTGMIEGDFSGVSNNDINGLRLRHAYVKMKWKHAELLVGQFWHPIFTLDAVPNVVSLNTGAPFQPFIRNPQVSLTTSFGKFSVLASFITQRDNSSDGPDGFSPNYMRNAVMPNAHLQFQYKDAHHACGLGGDYKILKPRLLNMNQVITGEKLGTWAVLAYYRFSMERLSFKLKGIYGQNLTEHLMMGGYALATADSTSGEYTYTPTNHLYSWINLTYGKKFQGSIFAGFIKNFGTSSDNLGIYYCRGKDIDILYRIAPSFAYVVPKFQLSFETEYTVANYGTPDIQGVVRNTHNVPNLRLLLCCLYFF